MAHFVSYIHPLTNYYCQEKKSSKNIKPHSDNIATEDRGMVPQNKWNNTDKATEESILSHVFPKQSRMQVVYLKVIPKSKIEGLKE